MADLNLIVDNQPNQDLIVDVNQTSFNSLLSDEVVMQWLMELEAEDGSEGLDDARYIRAVPSH